LFADVEELDAIGPWEVLSYWTHTFPEDRYRVSTLSAAGGLVRCAKGLVVQRDSSYTDAPAYQGARVPRRAGHPNPAPRPGAARLGAPAAIRGAAHEPRGYRLAGLRRRRLAPPQLGSGLGSEPYRGVDG